MCKLKEFNPTSRHHIAWAFEQFRGWTPIERTATGTPKIDDEVLKELGTPEALKFARFLNYRNTSANYLKVKMPGLNKSLKVLSIIHAFLIRTLEGCPHASEPCASPL